MKLRANHGFDFRIDFGDTVVHARDSEELIKIVSPAAVNILAVQVHQA
jgi:hypothetical protein